MKRTLIELSVFFCLVFFLSSQSAAKQTKVSGAIPVDTTDSPAYVRNEIIVKFRDYAAENIEKQLTNNKAPKETWPSSLQRLNEKYKLAEVKPLARGFSKNRQLIKDLEKKNKFLLNPREKHILQRARRAPRVVVEPNLENIYRIQFDLDANESIKNVLETYRNDPAVEYAELNYIASACSMPNDPYYNVQWALNNTGQSYPIPAGETASGTSDADIDGPEAWDYTWSSDIIVAVVDSGVDYTHEDLIGRMWDDGSGHHGYDFVNDDDDPMDDNGHGTHCAGIIAANANNSLDIAGICWNAKIMAVKGLDCTGSGNLSDLYNAIVYAVDNGADIISNSWGGYFRGIDTIELAINYAYTNGVIVVAAAGNNNANVEFDPAYYNHVISVAATDSDDQKASFSNYGEWVDIAAPGVDILSLRAQNTDMYVWAIGYTPGDRFIPYGNPNATMYIASGTSMACPYVSGACAVLLSASPAMTSDEATEILMSTGDLIAEGICGSNRRLNLYGATIEAIRAKSRGHFTLDNDHYNCDSSVGIYLIDGDLGGQGVHNVSISTAGGDFETVTLIEENPIIGAFSETIQTASGGPSLEDGIIQVTHGDFIYANYYDANYGDGNPMMVTDTAAVDCIPPVISNVCMEVIASKLIVTFDTDELTSGSVSCGFTCGGPFHLQGDSPGPQTTHIFTLSPILPSTTYYLLVSAIDVFSNQTVDSNSGNCYSLTTTGPDNIYVPIQFATIQEAVDHSWNSSVIWVADGTYTGQGNRDIDFKGLAITVRSENGPVNCIIDCQANFADTHNGFFFHSGETQNSVLDGFTITHGYAPSGRGGGGICCTGASPTIKNCIIINNEAGEENGGGIGCYEYSCPDINNCIISGNTAMIQGGFSCYDSDPLISNCIFTENGDQAFVGIESSPVFRNCLFANNFAEYGGAAVHFEGFAGGPPGTSGRPSNPSFYNCTFTGNSANFRGGGIYLYINCHATVSDCIFWGNTAPDGHEIYLYSSTMVISYSDIQSAGGGIYVGSGSSITYGSGVIYTDPRFVEGLQGEYYLSQIAAGQAANSPCVDAGSNTASNLAMNYKTTRTDQGHDCSTGDIGYHYPADISIGIDLNRDAFINFIDYTLFADGWRQPSNLCDPNSGDITKDGLLDINDLALLVENWLTCFVTEAFSPEPADQAVIMSRNTILQWSPGNNTASHDIYFGTDFYEVENAGTDNSGVYMGNQLADYWDTNNYGPDELDINMTYFWRTDEIAAGCEAKGAVWSFRTPPLPGQAGNPSPNNAATDVDRTALLVWTAGSFAASHDVYFGTTNPPTFRGNQTGTIYDTELMDADTIYYWRIDEKNVCGTTTGVLWNFETGSASEANDINIVSWWRFDEGTGTVAYDSRGVNNGNLMNGPAWASGIINGGLSFDGINDYVLIPYNSSLNLTEFFTLAFWIYVDANVLPFGAVISKDGEYEMAPAYNVYVGYGGVRTVCFTDKDMGAPELITEPNSLSPGAWNHVVVTFNDSASPQARIYIDGVEKISGTQPAPYLQATYLTIGRCGGGFDPSYLNSPLDDVRIYNRDLSAEEVLQLYQSGL